MPALGNMVLRATYQDLSSRSHENLLALRRRLPADDVEAQRRVALYEHKAFTREYVEENPALGPAAGYIGPWIYQAVKLLNLHPSRSGVDMRQIPAAYQGVHEGQQRNRAGVNKLKGRQRTAHPRG